jgi:Glyoxalase/Bleomycin resistance protein/Dioxygenase superfamily
MRDMFGRISQVGYVVGDIGIAMSNWVGRGIGPWFYVERVEMDYFRHRGADSDAHVSIALACSGELQIEIIQQRDRAPSPYREFLDSGHSGLHHLAHWTTHYDALQERMVALGYQLVSEGRIGGEQGRFAYFETERDPGSVIEISDVSGPKGTLFEQLHDLAACWDGADPVRRLG